MKGSTVLNQPRLLVRQTVSLLTEKIGLSKWQWFVSALMILAVLVWQVNFIMRNWMIAGAAEQEWVAGSMVAGYGFSFDPGTAWLGPYGDGTAYTATAWVEPLYAVVIAMVFRIFQLPNGRLALTLLNWLWLSGSVVLVYLMVRDLASKHIALCIVLLYILIHGLKPEVLLYIGNAALAGFLYCAVVYVLIRHLTEPSIGRSILLGIIIGLANLNHAGSLLLAPLCALVIVIWAGIRNRAGWQSASIVIVLMLAMVLPWVVRNYVVFGAIFPMRSGFGFQIYVGNPGLAETFTTPTGSGVNSSDPPWVANSPAHALRLMKGLNYDRAVRLRALAIVSQMGGRDYQESNEVERDRFFFSQALNFIRAEPLIFIQLVFWKAVALLTFWRVDLSLVSVAAVVGALRSIKDIRLLGILAMVLGYAIPYVVSLPLYYRYRSPIEPLLFVLAGQFLWYGSQLARSIAPVLLRRVET